MTLYRRQGSRPSPRERNAKRQKDYLRSITLQIAEKKREAKGKGDCSHEIKRRLLLGRKVIPPRQHIEKQRYYFANKGPSSQGYGFSSGHVCM